MMAACSSGKRSVSAETFRIVYLNDLHVDCCVDPLFASFGQALAATRSLKPKAKTNWMAGAPRVSRYRQELAVAMREQVSSGGDVYLGPTDAEIAADALDGF